MNSTSELYYCYLDTPVGDFLLAGTEQHLHYTSFATGKGRRFADSHWVADASLFKQAMEQFTAYFAGDLTEFDLEHTLNGTPFQNKVWEALKTIPFGCTASYGDIARQVGSPGGSQAVGAANGANPLPILIPCHRVIGADGSLTGFGGGLETKHKLLRHEGIPTAEDQLTLFVE